MAFVDVDVEATNDAQIHVAGDELLRDVATAPLGQLRSHDLIVRYGGDEFGCALPGMANPDAQLRFAAVQALLSDLASSPSVSVGLVALLPGEGVRDVVARDDDQRYRSRGPRDRRGDLTPLPRCAPAPEGEDC